MKSETSKNVETVKMVTNAMRVMDQIRNANTPLSAKEISNSCKINVATVQKILNTLESTHWAQVVGGDHYKGSNKLLMITDRRNFYKALADVAANILPAYVERKNQAMNVMILEGCYCRIIQQARTNNLIDYVPPVNSELPFYTCSGGKVLLSESGDSILNNLFEFCEIVPFTSHTICDPGEFRKELDFVVKNGYALDYHEVLNQGSCVGVPIRDPEGNILASLSYSGILETKKEELKEFVPLLQEAALEIRNALFVGGQDR